MTKAQTKTVMKLNTKVVRQDNWWLFWLMTGASVVGDDDRS